MKTILASTGLAFALLAAAPAFASPPPTPTAKAATSSKPAAKPAHVPATERNSVGIVKAYDAAKGTLILQNGRTYRMSADLAKQPVTVGQKVDVQWTMKDKHRVADRITSAK